MFSQILHLSSIQESQRSLEFSSLNIRNTSHFLWSLFKADINSHDSFNGKYTACIYFCHGREASCSSGHRGFTKFRTCFCQRRPEQLVVGGGRWDGGCTFLPITSNLSHSNCLGHFIKEKTKHHPCLGFNVKVYLVMWCNPTNGMEALKCFKALGIMKSNYLGANDAE